MSTKPLKRPMAVVDENETCPFIGHIHSGQLNEVINKLVPQMAREVSGVLRCVDTFTIAILSRTHLLKPT